MYLLELYPGHIILPARLWPSDDDDDDGDDDDGDDDDDDVDKTRSVADAHDSLCPPARSPSHRQSPTGHLSFPQEFPIIHIHIHRPSCISTSTSLFLPLLSSVHPSYPQNTPLIHKTSLILKPSLLSRRHPYYPQNTPVNHKTSLILKPSLLSTRHPSFPESIRHRIFKRLNMVSNC